MSRLPGVIRSSPSSSSYTVRCALALIAGVCIGYLFALTVPNQNYQVLLTQSRDAMLACLPPSAMALCEAAAHPTPACKPCWLMT